MAPADPFSQYVFEVARRTNERLGVGPDASLDEAAAALGIPFEEAAQRWEAARSAVEDELAAQGITQPPVPSPEEFLASLDLSEDVHAVPSDEVDGDEGWQRLSEEPHVRGVEVTLTRSSDWPWVLSVWVMEFVREEPLESTLRRRIDEALRAVPGVTDVIEDDREVWVLRGTPSGAALVQAVAAVVDELAPQLRRFVDPSNG